MVVMAEDAILVELGVDPITVAVDLTMAAVDLTIVAVDQIMVAVDPTIVAVDLTMVAVALIVKMIVVAAVVADLQACPETKCVALLQWADKHHMVTEAVAAVAEGNTFQ